MMTTNTWTDRALKTVRERRTFFRRMLASAATPDHRAECRDELSRLAGLGARLVQRRQASNK